MTTLTALTCEYQINPLAVGEHLPRFSWQMTTSRRGARQQAYQILVATSPELLAEDHGNLWDSGMVSSRQSAHIAYAGSPLVSRQRCFWKVRITDDQGVVSPWSDVQCWEMGLLDDTEWCGEWISHAPNEPELNPRPAYYFRRPFVITKPVSRVRAYATARGIYELWMNGRRVGQDFFQPGWTEYHKRLHVQTYDLGEYLIDGNNVIGAVLAEGWYCGRVGWEGNRNIYGDRPELYVQLEIEYIDGTRETIISDGEWQCGKGPIIASGFLLGETYDARLAIPGWSTAEFDAIGWHAPKVSPRDSVRFQHAFHPPIRPRMELRPQEISSIEPGVFLVDLGQNMVGRIRLRMQGPAGTQVIMRFGEMRYPDGRLYTENLRSAASTDTYILSGKGEEIYESSFTFHGFRYVEVRGYPGTLQPDDLCGVVLSSSMQETGQFSCSHPLVNQLYRNILWGQRGNFLDVPTDCPQRDERLGWMGDGQVFAGAACYNMDLAAFYSKWADDINDAQYENGCFTHVAPDILPRSPEHAKAMNFTWETLYGGMAVWGDAGVIIPWTVYLHYGDVRLLERCYPHMQAWVAYLEAHSEGYLRPAEGFGDWLSINADTPKDVLATAYFAYVTKLVGHIAMALGKPNDATRYETLFEKIRLVFNKAYVTSDGRVAGETQTGYLLALNFDLLPEELRAQAAAHLADDIRARGTHLSSGFVGISYLAPVLTENGYADLAYELLLQETFPSWLYPVLQGATTIWERWDGWTHDRGFQNPGMNSFNHYSLGAVGKWLFSSVAGIAPDPKKPGFAHAIIHPTPASAMDYAEGEYLSLYGRYASRWEWSDDQLMLNVTVPSNCSATLYLPTDTADTILENGTPLNAVTGITDTRIEQNKVVCEIGAGSYQFAISSARKYA